MNGSQAPRVLVLALDPKLAMDPQANVRPARQYKRIIGLAGHFAEEGAQVDVVTAEAGGWQGLDERVRLHKLDDAEARHPLPWLEFMLVIKVPRRIVRPVARLGRPGALLESARKRFSQFVHQRLFIPFYRQVRPLLLARIARRRVLRGIDPAQVARVIVMDRMSVPLGRRLTRLHPDIVVTTQQVRSFDAKP